MIQDTQEEYDTRGNLIGLSHAEQVQMLGSVVDDGSYEYVKHGRLYKVKLWKLVQIEDGRGKL